METIYYLAYLANSYPNPNPKADPNPNTYPNSNPNPNPYLAACSTVSLPKVLAELNCCDIAPWWQCRNSSAFTSFSMNVVSTCIGSHDLPVKSNREPPLCDHDLYLRSKHTLIHFTPTLCKLSSNHTVHTVLCIIVSRLTNNSTKLHLYPYLAYLRLLYCKGAIYVLFKSTYLSNSHFHHAAAR